MSHENLKEVEIITQRNKLKDTEEVQDDKHKMISSKDNLLVSSPENSQAKPKAMSPRDQQQISTIQQDQQQPPNSAKSDDKNVKQPNNSNNNQSNNGNNENSQTGQIQSNQAIKMDQNKQEAKTDVTNKDPDQQEVDIFNVEEKKVQKFPILLKILDNDSFQSFVTLLTMYALFADDIRVLATRESADIGFDVITLICLFTFSLEIALSIIVRDGYAFSFFFWLDLVSTVSLILDVQIISKQLFYGGQAVNAASLARAGRASRVGTKAGRVVRLVRLIRIVKLYKAASDQQPQKKTIKEQLEEKRKKKARGIVYPDGINNNLLTQSQQGGNNNGNNLNIPSSPRNIENSKQFDSLSQNRSSQIANKFPEQQQPISDDDPEDPSELKESRVSKKLSDLTTKRVIIIVLLLLFIMPLFSADYFFDPPKSVDFSCKMLKEISEFKGSTELDIIHLFDSIKDQHSYLSQTIAVLQTPFDFVKNFEDDDYKNLRNDEHDDASYYLDPKMFLENHPLNSSKYQVYITTNNTETYSFTASISTRNLAVITAGLSLGRTIFVCIVLSMGAMLFSKDANDLALRPIERMIIKVNKIAKNPISSKEQQLIKSQDQYETVIIENAIIKIGTLLALGFGDAGSEIIGSNMQRGGDVDPMLPGQKKVAIYGFCDIRNFTDATEVLQEDVMLFVNNIGDIVHTMVDRYQGAANKNIGDAFLLVWKLLPDKYKLNEDNSIEYLDKVYISIMADFAGISFMQIQAKLNRVPKILAYRQEQRLQERMKNYKVKMGFGLHVGWGIEGAIGSEFKIDASYLSPNVNMASRLEAATKQYGVPLLISSDLQEIFSSKMKRFTRYIDRVTVKGSIRPIGLYTIDMVVDGLQPSKDPEQQEFTKQERQEIIKEKKNYIKQFLLDNNFDAEQFIRNNKDLSMMMKTWDENFQNKFNEAFQNYLGGNWPLCKQQLEDIKKIVPEDGPSKTILEVMEEHNFKAPADWAGYRVLTEK